MDTTTNPISASVYAEFKPKLPGQEYYTIKDVISPGEVCISLNFGILEEIIEEQKRVVFLFSLKEGQYQYVAWSYLPEGKAYSEKLKKRNRYVLRVTGTTIQPFQFQKEYFLGYHSDSEYCILLRTFDVVEETTFPSSTRELPKENNFEIVRECITVRKSLVRKFTNISISEGTIYRYWGCSFCTKSIKVLDDDLNPYCQKCKKATIAKKCIIITMLTLRNERGETLENCVCYDRYCAGLLGKAALDRILESADDRAAKEALNQVVGSTIDVLVKIIHRDSYSDLEVVLQNIKVKVNPIPASLSDDDIPPQSETETAYPSFDSSESDFSICTCSQESQQNNEDCDNVNNGPSQTDLLITRELEKMRPITDVMRRNAYHITNDAPGLGIIFNMKFNDGKHCSHRPGSEKDVAAFEQLFKKLNIKQFKTTFEDMSRKEFLDAVQKFHLQLLIESYSFIFFVFMSHGAQNYGRLYDSLENSAHVWRDIMYQFSNKKLRSYIRKPKIFIFQLCQGIKVRGDFEVEDPTDCLTNTFYCVPCLPGYKAKRDEENGSRFIQCLVKVLEKCSDEMDFEKMFKLVQKILKRRSARNKKKERNDPLIIPLLVNRPLYFNVNTSDSSNAA